MLRRAVEALTLLSDLGSMNKISQLKGCLQVQVWQAYLKNICPRGTQGTQNEHIRKRLYLLYFVNLSCRNLILYYTCSLLIK